MFDAGIAAQTFCLAAYEKGLGSVVLGYFDDDELRKVVDIPEGQQVGAMIPIGFMNDAEVPVPPRKEVEKLVSFI
jgi:nitroreductase